MNARELAHIYVNQTNEELDRCRSGRASNFSFIGPALFSYQTEIARIFRRADGKRLVLMDSASFSNSTAKQQSRIRCAVRAADVNVSLPFGRRGQSLNHAPKFLWEVAIRECQDFAEQASKARGRAPYWLECANRSIATAEAVRQFFKLRNKPFAPDLSQLVAYAKHQAANRAEIEKRAAARKEKARTVLAPRMLALWRAGLEGTAEMTAVREAMRKAGLHGLSVSGLISTPEFTASAALRLNAERDRVETSQGAQVLVRTVRFLWAFCRSAKAAGVAVDAETVARFPRLDNYAAQSIDAGGNLVAGCHRIPFGEVEGIARELGLPPFDGSPAEAPTIPAEEVTA